ncbi:uncharacterized protein BCR38DRAFT_465696 [Pseudomassariella vexata]|uniref:Glucose-methanol-choline oxidoreductase N-terminal domain-containing protein n=1 Tax=Pseudomassariella vexata TaxID=1141098 RepID=A0A1Y2E2T2_9PEZI|nr:uncharacterized protein BCR38DRAFT_465696 [Pseudomassariella vexata]ORY65175.1 hypothetical protein BCR38DRAFT_465696 [Pseudomassariella vexata]
MNSGGTTGCVGAGRLAADSSVKVVVIEAGQHHEELKNVHRAGGFIQLFDKETDWTIVCEKGASIDDRQVEIFHNKSWYRCSKNPHGYGPLRIEPHDLASISDLVLDSMVSRGFNLEVRHVLSWRESPRMRKRTPRVLLERDSDGELRAAGVLVGNPAGTIARLTATKELIVSSGIGAKKELEAHDIDTIIDIPGVGKNLMDHLIVSSPREPGRDPMGLTSKKPHIDFWNTKYYLGPKQFDYFLIDHEYAFSMVAELFSPVTRHLQARSADPLEGHKVDFNYLADLLNVEVLAEACRFGNEVVMEGEGTRDFVTISWPPNLTHKYTTWEGWVPYVKENSTTCGSFPFVLSCHAAKRCAMGRANDPTTVVNEFLREDLTRPSSSVLLNSVVVFSEERYAQS